VIGAIEMRGSVLWKITTIPVILLVTFVLGGCGSQTSIYPDNANNTGHRVRDSKILENDQYQEPSPRNLTAKPGEVIELRVTNEDYKARTSEQSANSHPMFLGGPGES
jgi:hypothetical protein